MPRGNLHKHQNARGSTLFPFAMEAETEYGVSPSSLLAAGQENWCYQWQMEREYPVKEFKHQVKKSTVPFATGRDRYIYTILQFLHPQEPPEDKIKYRVVSRRDAMICMNKNGVEFMQISKYETKVPE